MLAKREEKKREKGFISYANFFVSFFKIAGVYVLLILTKGEQLKAPEGFVFALLLKNTKPKRRPRSGWRSVEA